MVTTVPWTVVIGGAGAIGCHVTGRLVDTGHRVLCVGRSEASLQQLRQRVPGVTSTLACDVTDPAIVSQITGAILNERVRMLVHMPAAPTAGGILDVPGDAVLAAVEVKVVALLRLVTGLAPAFEPDAVIVAVGGNLAYDPVPDAATSGIANAALANAVKQLHRALGGAARCFVVAPGPVETPRFHTVVRTEAERRGVSLAVVADEARAASPLGRLTTPGEVAWAIQRLSEPEAGALAGGTFVLDAGRRTAFP
jgi:NAD(P)-dependent dehydrogenase (short-subunit alcohol dehydrogenase family)